MVVGALQARDILWVWEHGQQSSTDRRALLVLMAAQPDADWQTLADLPLGEREERLLRVREQTLGARLDIYVTCPSCQAELEFELDTRERPGHEAPVSPFVFEDDGFRLELRSPTTADLLAVGHLADVDQARRALFARCLVSAERRGDAVDADAVPDDLLARAAEALSAHDPRAEWLHNLTCPMCSHQWRAALEMGAFLWREIEVEARRLLREVDLLARTYGWSEETILELTPFRRRCYLELITS